MKLILPGLLLLGSTVLGGTESSGPVTGQPILDAVVARLPTAPLDIHGDITVRKRRGVVLQVLKFDMALNWGASPSSALYTIRDSFGKELENMLIQQSRDTGVRVAYHAGDVEAAAQNLPLHTQIQETDISWADLTLAFLWWPNSRIVGQDNVRGRDCHVLEVPAPSDPGNRADSAREKSKTGRPYTSVRIWVDRDMMMMLQAVGLDADGEPIRKLWVKSLKKIDGHWMIKDMEIQSFPPIHRTRLRIREVSVAVTS